mgnify:FL=1
MQKQVNQELIYREEPLPLGSTKRIAEFENSRGSVNGGNRAYIRIPNLRNGMLDTANAFLKFTCQTTLVGTNLPFTTSPGGVKTNFNSVKLGATGCSSFIRSIDILSNSALVTRIDQANRIDAILKIANQGLESQQPLSVTEGASQSETGTLVGAIVADTWGEPDSTSIATKSITPHMTFTINGGILGLLGDGCMLPMFALKNGLELQIEFETDSRLSYQCIFGTTITQASTIFTNISYVAPVIEFEDSSIDEIIKSNGFGSRDVMWSGVGYHASLIQWPVTQQSAAGTYTALVPNNRFTSLKNLHMGAFNSVSLGAGVDDNMLPRIPVKSLQYRMNGQEYPIQKIDTLPKAVQNTIACHSNNSNSVASTLMKKGSTILNFRQIAPVGTIIDYQRGVIGLNLETWAETDSISGIDVSESDTEVLLESSGASATQPSTICFVSSYDVVYVVNDQGVLSASYS